MNSLTILNNTKVDEQPRNKTIDTNSMIFSTNSFKLSLLYQLKQKLQIYICETGHILVGVFYNICHNCDGWVPK